MLAALAASTAALNVSKSAGVNGRSPPVLQIVISSIFQLFGIFRSFSPEMPEML
jgi:hypothetical protein